MGRLRERRRGQQRPMIPGSGRRPYRPGSRGAVEPGAGGWSVTMTVREVIERLETACGPAGRAGIYRRKDGRVTACAAARSRSTAVALSRNTCRLLRYACGRLLATASHDETTRLCDRPGSVGVENRTILDMITGGAPRTGQEPPVTVVKGAANPACPAAGLGPFLRSVRVRPSPPPSARTRRPHTPDRSSAACCSAGTSSSTRRPRSSSPTPCRPRFRPVRRPGRPAGVDVFPRRIASCCSDLITAHAGPAGKRPA